MTPLRCVRPPPESGSCASRRSTSSRCSARSSSGGNGRAVPAADARRRLTWAEHMPKNMPVISRCWGVATSLALLLVAASYVYVLRDVYVTGRFTITHDSIANVAPYHLAFTGLRSGVLPLWSPEMNVGEPLWPTVELH